jgi:hypothetical protein
VAARTRSVNLAIAATGADSITPNALAVTRTITNGTTSSLGLIGVAGRWLPVDATSPERIERKADRVIVDDKD